MKVMFRSKNCDGIIYAIVPFWRQKYSLRNIDNPIADRETVENLIKKLLHKVI